ncbi:MAG: efflux RND transporter periplasmic adaptor subunit [Phycisphaerae bacterium]|nr:efflux RND transporter periplasmic adaptor subunit [Phycisphaerae bacterium]
MNRLVRVLRFATLTAAAIAGIVVLMMWLAGFWAEKTPPGPPTPPQSPLAAGLPMMTVQPVQVALTNEAIGTIRAEHEIALSSRLPMPAQVALMKAAPGDVVPAGELLVRLNDSQLRAQLAAAQANLTLAKDDNERITRLNREGHAAPREITTAASNLAMAQAKYDEASALLGYAEIRAPGGLASQPDAATPDAPKHWFVIDRYAEVGDTAQPGQPLVRLFDRLQLTAVVPESLRPHIEIGQSVAVRIDALNKECVGRINEIVPQASEQSRSFQVKVTGPCQPGVIVGMFARMKVPTGQTELELQVPQAAIRRVGQLTSVFVERDGRLVRQFVQTGREAGDKVVVSSGLSAGDRILTDAAKATSD